METFFEKLYEHIRSFCICIYQLCGVKPTDFASNRPIQPTDVFHVALANIVCVIIFCLFCIGIYMICRYFDKKGNAILNKIEETRKL